MTPKFHEKITKFTQFTKNGFKEFYSTQVNITSTSEKWRTTPSGYKRKEVIEETTQHVEVFNTLEEAEDYLASIRPVKEEVISERFM